MRTVLEALEDQVTRRPDTIAFTYLSDGEEREISLTWAELKARALAIADGLTNRTEPGARALLAIVTGLEFFEAFFGCLYARVIPVPICPPLPFAFETSAAHMQAVGRDADARLVLTTRQYLDLLASGDEFSGLGFEWHAVDEWRAGGPTVDPILPAPDEPAYLQYTAGTTGSARGVLVNHDAFYRQLAMGAEQSHLGRGGNAVTWLPMYHDQGVITALVALSADFRVYMMSPLHFLERPARWTEAISRYGATATTAPNFGLELVTRRVPREAVASLDLSTLTMVPLGGERIRAETMQRFAEHFAPAGFRPSAFVPAYGLAEAVCVATIVKVPDAPPRVLRLDGAALANGRVREAGAECDNPVEIVSCGAPFAPTRFVVVDPETGAPAAADAVGELWLQSDALGSGYWRQPDESDAVFRARLPGCDGTFLRTGDLGFVHAGEVFPVDRIKDLIIVRGRNIHPSDVETTAQESHADLRRGCGVAFPIEVDGEETLGIAFELTRDDHPDPGQVVSSIRGAVSRAYQAPIGLVALVTRGSVPKTSSGKLQRRKAAAALAAGDLTLVHEWRRTHGTEPARDSRG